MSATNNNRNNNRLHNAAKRGLMIPLLLLACTVWAQEEKTAVIKLVFEQSDSSKTCKAVVLASDSTPVKGTDVHLYVKRMYSLLEVGKVTATDETGTAAINFPKDLPGDKNDMITVIAKIEGDEVYGNAETTAAVKWGVHPDNESYNWATRSLSASSEKAPMFLVIVSIAIIMGIWGTILYLIAQLFRIKRSGRALKKATIPA